MVWEHQHQLRDLVAAGAFAADCGHPRCQEQGLPQTFQACRGSSSGSETDISGANWSQLQVSTQSHHYHVCQDPPWRSAITFLSSALNRRPTLSGISGPNPEA
jgi:hypothetical protein